MANIELHHGDALEVMKSIQDNSIDLIFTDPPYGHNNNNNDLIHRWEDALGVKKTDQEDARPILNDGKEANDLFKKCLHEYKRILVGSGGCCCCCCGGGGPDPQFARWSLWMDEVLSFDQMIVWDKGPMGMGWRYRRSYETVLVAHKGKSFKWYDDSHKIENIIRNFRKIIPTDKEHPTQKPVELATHFIRLHTKPGDTVLDPFMGSGTTGLACQLLGRNFIGIELDEQFYKMANARLSVAKLQPVLITA